MSCSSNTVSLDEFCLKADKKSYLKLGEELVNKNVGKSFSLLSFGISLDDSKKEEYYQLYLKVVESWINKLTESSRYQDVLKIFDVAQDIYPGSPDLEYLLACTLYRIGKLREAWQYSVKVLQCCRHDPKARDLASSLANALIDRWHFPMLNDAGRNAKYEAAIRGAVLRRGGRGAILDIGAGSALLSIYAHQAGSRAIYACEVDEFMAEMAADILTLNSAQEGIVLLNKHSQDLTIPSDIPAKVSLIVTETFDAGLFGEHILHTLKHAWHHLAATPLPPPHPGTNTKADKEEEEDCQANGAIVLPSHAEVWVAILQCDYVAREIKMMRSVDMFKGRTLVLNPTEPYLSEKVNSLPGNYTLLTEWQKVLNVNFNSLPNIEGLLSGEHDAMLRLPIKHEGRGDGIILAYKLFLNSDVSIDTFPESGTCWENAVYPILSSSRLSKGSEATVSMKCDGVLHFELTDLPPVPSSVPTDLQFMKCVNSSSYSNFYRGIAEEFYLKNETAFLTVLDSCPFPQAGITLLERNSNTKLFVSSESVLHTLSQLRIKAKPLEALKGLLDVIYYWPFTPEGTLKDNIFEELQSYGKLLTKRGKIYPEFLTLQMIGISSDLLTQMTRIENSKTCGVDIAQVFNLLKTQHHLDVPIEGIPYNPLTPVLSPARLELNGCHIVHNGQEMKGNNPLGFLVVGGNLCRSTLPFRPICEGTIDGFVYGFELSNIKCSVDQEASSSSGSDQDNGYKQRFEMKSLHQELPLKIHHKQKYEILFDSFSRDSPINQCVLLLDDPFNVYRDQNLNLDFAMSENHFSVNVNCDNKES